MIAEPHAIRPRTLMDPDLPARVRAFVTREVCVKLERLRPETTLLGDLGVAGADGWELIEAFGTEFGVDLTGFDALQCFGPEGGGDPFTLLYWFIAEVVCRRETHAAWGLTPVTIKSLIESAERRTWLP